MQGRGPIQVVDKLWGQEIWYANTARYCCKRLYLNAGFSSSLHWHREKFETFIVESGACFIEVAGVTHAMSGGDWIELPAGTVHRFWNNWMYECVILEISTHHDDADVVRIEESRELREDKPA